MSEARRPRVLIFEDGKIRPVLRFGVERASGTKAVTEHNGTRDFGVRDPGWVEIHEATSYQEAIAVLEQGPVDLVITDPVMPKALALLEHLRNSGRPGADTRIIAHSAELPDDFASLARLLRIDESDSFKTRCR